MAAPARNRFAELGPPVAVFGVALGLLLIHSRATGPAFDELARLASAERAAELVKRVAARGLSEIATPEAKQELASGPALVSLLSAWCKLSLGRLGLVDALTAVRIPWLVLGSLASVALWGLLRPSRGPWVALTASVALVMTPRWMHGVVVEREGALVGCSWLIVLGLYVRSLGPARLAAPRAGARRSLGWAVAGAVGLGLGLALSLATLWVLLPLCLHHALARWPSTRRLLRRGRIPVPTLLLAALPLAPAVLLALTPALWRATGAGLASFVLAPLAPNVTPTEYAGAVVSATPVPAGYAFDWLLFTLPVALTASLAVGVGAVLREPLARRFASGRLRPAPDRHAVGMLALIVLACVVIGPALAPRVLTTFPPRAEIALPFVAVLAAIGLELLTRLVSNARVARIALAVLGLGLALTSLARPATAALEFAPLFGGARLVGASHALPFGDGSELAVLTPALERVGADPVRLALPREVPPGFWDALHDAGRLRPRVVPAPGGLALVRGAPPGGVRVSEVKRDGVVAWTLVR